MEGKSEQEQQVTHYALGYCWKLIELIVELMYGSIMSERKLKMCCKWAHGSNGGIPAC
jgi:hypothetical protein